jgi:aldehyde:ferredoxin oxidoreductase
MIGGYCNRLLRIDLTTQQCTVTSLPDEATLRMYIGGLGLGMKLLLDETRPGLCATDPDSPLIMLAGPLAGTSAPSASNLAIVSLDYNTPSVIATSRSHGYWAAYLKHAGYDGVVVMGKSEKPVFLWVADENVEIRDASAFWGLDTRETERLIKYSLRDESKISVACIGPAGEAILPGASIRIDRNHGAHEGSVGAIMGSKRLKAIVVRGSKQVPLKDAIGFNKVTRQWADANHAECSRSDATAMTQGSIERIHSHVNWCMLCSETINNPTWKERFSKRLFSAIAESWTVVPKASYNCNITCAYDFHINEGEFAGFTASMYGGSENLVGTAALFGIEDPAVAIALTDYFDAMGMHSYFGGALMSAAFELYNRGVLNDQDTEGLQLTWGNFEAARALLDQMIEGRGFGGHVLAKGLKEGAHILGLAAKTCALHPCSGGIKKQDWQRAWNMLLIEIFSSTNVCWRGPGVDVQTSEPNLGYTDAAAVSEQQCEVDATAKATELLEGCLGVCSFASKGGEGAIDYATHALICATGWEDFSAEEALLVGERIAVLQRYFATMH